MPMEIKKDVGLGEVRHSSWNGGGSWALGEPKGLPKRGLTKEGEGKKFKKIR